MKRRMKTLTLILSSLALATVLRAGPPPSADDVGDADSFGKPALFMGAASGFITLSTNPCPSPTPTPAPPSTVNNTQCFVLNPAPAITTFDAQDIARIKLPKNATKDNIYPVFNLFLNYQLQNSTGAPQPQGLFSFTAYMIIESTVLNDPSVIDPGTGLPANGKITFEFDYNYRDDRTMQDGDRQRVVIMVPRVGNTGVNKAQLVAQGIPSGIVDSLFKNPMTVRMSVTGSAKLCTDVSITGNMRLFGD
jgi:hypothetical protein